MFREITSKDKNTYMKYVDIFYNSNVVDSPIPKENYEITFNELMNDSPYLKCYIFEENDKPCGFALLSKTFSQEAGGISITVEEIYLDEDKRGKGYASEFFDFIKKEFKAARYRIEVEEDNVRAKALYKRNGFAELPYIQMVTDKYKED